MFTMHMYSTMDMFTMHWYSVIYMCTIYQYSTMDILIIQSIPNRYVHHTQ
jgi:hypothetical protein